MIPRPRGVVRRRQGACELGPLGQVGNLRGGWLPPPFRASAVASCGRPQTRQRAEPEGRKIVAHGAEPWVAGGRRLPAPERGERRTAAPGSSAPVPGLRRGVALPVLTHWATIFRPTGWDA